MKTADFDFELPEGLIALRPVADRDHSRLMVLHRDGRIEHRLFHHIKEYLHSGDMLVLNDTKVMPVRLLGSKPSGGRLDIVLTRENADGSWEALCKGGYEGSVLFRNGIRAELVWGERDAASAERPRYLVFTERPEGSIHEVFELCGSMPLPPYIKRLPDEADKLSYQTVYASNTGSIAAPTAGLHFTDALLASIRAEGVDVRTVTLHVGAGTFKPVKSERVADHGMLPEYFEIDNSLPGAIAAVKAAGKRVVTVGTTATRALEGFTGGRYEKAAEESPSVIKGSTDIFIYPGYRFLASDSLLTNFHLPRSTPLMLAAAFCGFDRLRDSYREAIAREYRFFSYGDAMLIL